MMAMMRMKILMMIKMIMMEVMTMTMMACLATTVSFYLSVLIRVGTALTKMCIRGSG